MIWELFDHIIKDWDAAGDKDESFLKRLKESYSKLDPGVRVGSWGQIQGKVHDFSLPMSNMKLITCRRVEAGYRRQERHSSPSLSPLRLLPRLCHFRRPR